MCKFCDDYKKAIGFFKVNGVKPKVMLKAEVEDVFPEGMSAFSRIRFDCIYEAGYCPMCGRKLVDE